MSLVEKALQKLRELPVTSPPAAPSSAGRAYAEIVAEPSPSRLPDGPVSIRRTVQIDREALRAAGYLPPQKQERRLADQFRQIKRPILTRALGRGGEAVPNGRLALLSSSFTGEGKTFTSLNLAFSLAREKDVFAVLIDADVLRPQLSRMLGIVDEPGLMDVLQDPSRDLESAMLPTDMNGLYVVSAGRAVENATEFLSSRRMEQVMKQLFARHPDAIVLLDSSPLLLTSESRALAQMVGQVVLIVRAGSTPQPAVLESLRLLGENKPVGLVLNQTEFESPVDYYGGGSGYGTYGDHDPVRPGREAQ